MKFQPMVGPDELMPHLVDEHGFDGELKMSALEKHLIEHLVERKPDDPRPPLRHRHAPPRPYRRKYLRSEALFKARIGYEKARQQD